MTHIPLPSKGRDGTESVANEATASRHPRFPEVEDHFGEEVARRYDDADSEMFRPDVIDATVEFLASFCNGGRALEFGIGTGRIAIPLSRHGIQVTGIDLSPAMIAQLESKLDGGQIETLVGDFATTKTHRSFDLVYLVYNTIMNLTCQSQQVECFRNAASHLAPGGHFVVEVMVPALRQLPPGQTVHPFEVSDMYWGLDEYDTISQRLVSHHLQQTEDGCVRSSVPFRYVWPSELDLMANLAGMIPVERWADWNRNPFTEESTSHVSVWRRTS